MWPKGLRFVYPFVSFEDIILKHPKKHKEMEINNPWAK